MRGRADDLFCFLVRGMYYVACATGVAFWLAWGIGGIVLIVQGDRFNGVMCCLSFVIWGWLWWSSRDSSMTYLVCYIGGPQDGKQERVGLPHALAKLADGSVYQLIGEARDVSDNVLRVDMHYIGHGREVFERVGRQLTAGKYEA